jgi:nucleoid DNA-binding protein
MDGPTLRRLQDRLKDVPVDWGRPDGQRKGTDLGTRVARDTCEEIAFQLGLESADTYKLLVRLGQIVAQRLENGDLSGLPGVGVFYLKTRPTPKTRIPKIRPRFQFSTALKKRVLSAPNKGTPHEQYTLRSSSKAPTTVARRRHELPGGFYPTRVGTLAGVGQTGRGPVPSRGRRYGTSHNWAERLRDVATKKRFKTELKRAAIAAD